MKKKKSIFLTEGLEVIGEEDGWLIRRAVRVWI
jgi:hypothetical protein